MDEDATWYGSRLGPGHIVLDGDAASPPRERGRAALTPLFGPCPLWPRWPISATDELLLRILKPEVTYSQSMDHATRLITIGRIYYSTAMRPGSNKPLLLGRFTVLRT